MSSSLGKQFLFPLLFLLFFILLFQASLLSVGGHASEGKPIPFKLKQEESLPPPTKKDLSGTVEILLFEKTNQMRNGKKLPSMTSNGVLIKAARYHSGDMMKRNYLSHISPEGKSPLDRIQKFKPGYDESCGENVHNIYSPQGLRDPAVVADQMMKDWMGSPDHRKNILSKEYTLLGVGCATDGFKIFCTQVFSGPNI